MKLSDEISTQVNQILTEYDRSSFGKKWLYYTLIEKNPDLLNQTTPKGINIYIALALRKSGFKNTSKSLNWWVRK